MAEKYYCEHCQKSLRFHDDSPETLEPTAALGTVSGGYTCFDCSREFTSMLPGSRVMQKSTGKTGTVAWPKRPEAN